MAIRMVPCGPSRGTKLGVWGSRKGDFVKYGRWAIRGWWRRGRKKEKFFEKKGGIETCRNGGGKNKNIMGVETKPWTEKIGQTIE